MIEKTLSDWLSHYETLHAVGIDMGLERVAEVWQVLCQIYHIKSIAKQKVITVAGTNGKGSACQMLSMLLVAQGYRVGVYTSPHIHRFNERVKINAMDVDDAILVCAFEAIETARGSLTLSYFEATTLAGLLVFAWQEVDYAVLEVGLGGRLDAINVIDADAVLITSIALDHEAFLGNDLAAIAIEKAGVCRPYKPAVYAQSDIYDALIDYAKGQKIPLYSRDNAYQIDGAQVFFQEVNYVLPDRMLQLGEHQIDNAAGVVVLLHLLDLLPENYSTILANFSVMGRLQQIATKPDVVLDVAHNAAAAKALADYLQREKNNYSQLIAVVGMLGDKDHRAVLEVFNGVFDAVYCGSTWGERGFSDIALADCAKTLFSVPVSACGDLQHALITAKKSASDKDLIIAFGSFLVVEALFTR